MRKEWNSAPILGLKENWQQFTLLVLVNAFVGGMLGMERSILPQFASETFGIESKTAIFSFIIAFGISKALSNYFAGKLINKFGGRNVLIIGWIMAIPIPFMLIYSPNWNYVIFTNVFMGISQGLAWSSTVIMKIDLVGQKNRGFAMGLNEFSGYLTMGIVAFISAYIADKFGISPYPFYIGILLSIVGFVISTIWIKNTQHFVYQETQNSPQPLAKNLFVHTTFTHKTLSAITQAGWVNNMNDGMIWGLLPLLLMRLHFDATQIGSIAAMYPVVWGIGQLFTGKMSDHYSKKAMLFWGMLLQGIAIICIPFGGNYLELLILSGILGFGTALVYPTFISSIAAVCNPKQRAESIGIFRLWRDLGYAFGALASGIIADIWGIDQAIFAIAAITILSAAIIQLRMPKIHM